MAKLKLYFILASLLAGMTFPVFAQDSSGLMTLFTTARERQLINNNRYKGDKPVQPVAKPEPQVEQAEVESLPKEEVNASYRISGVSTNTEGSKTAWVNGKAYVSGDTLDDGSKIRIRKTSVVITTIDGKSYTAAGGEVLDVTYLRAVNQ